MIVTPLRSKETFLESVRATENYRQKLARKLQRYHGAVAIFSAIDVGQKGNPHLHWLVYSPFIARAQLQHFQQAFDCTVPGCKHVAGDRACEGSWDVHIKEVDTDAVREVLKYSVSPKADSDYHIALFLAMYGKHRVQTYGLARKKILRAVEDAYDDEHVKHKCPICDKVMPIVQQGYIRNHVVHLFNVSDTG
jgi:hypothetical protein